MHAYSFSSIYAAWQRRQGGSGENRGRLSRLLVGPQGGRRYNARAELGVGEHSRLPNPDSGLVWVPRSALGTMCVSVHVL
jgi:hypothetical protein